MRVDDFDFELPSERIALRPARPRDSARLLLVDGNVISDRSVLDLPAPVDMITVYVQPDVARALLPEFLASRAPEVWLNPGADDDEVLAEAKRIGLPVIAACSIMGIGRRPAEF